MYSLPITTYTDYWRRTKMWSSYLGGLAVFSASTRYSTLNNPDIWNTLHLPFQTITQTTTQSINPDKLINEVSFMDTRQKASSQRSVRREISIQGTVSRGFSNRSVTGQNKASPSPSTQDATGMDKASLDESQEDTDSLNSTRTDTTSLGAIRANSTSSDLARPDTAKGEVIDRGISSNEISSESSGNSLAVKIQVVDKEIPFETKYIETDKLLPGMTQVQQNGEKGMLRQVVKTHEVSGQPVNQQVQSSVLLQSPKQEVVLQNTKPIPKKKVAIENSKPVMDDGIELAKLAIKKTFSVESTAYTYTGSKTATGVEPREGLIAVDPKVIAMGSKVYIEGYGYAIAADTGGDIRGDRIDVFFPTLRQCIDWGRKPVHIYVLEPS